MELPGDGANSPADLAAALLDARTWMASEAGRVEEQSRTFESLEHDRQLALAAREIIASGFPKVEPEGFNLTIGTAADAEAAAARAASQQKTLSAALTQFETMATRRIACALALLREPDAGPTSVPMDGLDSATRAELGGEGEHLRQTLNALAGIWPHLNELYEASELCGHLSANVTNSPKPDLTADRLKRAFERFDAALRNIHAALVGLPGPHPSSNVTLLAAIGMPEDAGVKAEEGVVLARTGATSTTSSDAWPRSRFASKRRWGVLLSKAENKSGGRSRRSFRQALRVSSPTVFPRQELVRIDVSVAIVFRLYLVGDPSVRRVVVNLRRRRAATRRRAASLP